MAGKSFLPLALKALGFYSAATAGGGGGGGGGGGAGTGVGVGAHVHMHMQSSRYEDDGSLMPVQRTTRDRDGAPSPDGAGTGTGTGTGAGTDDAHTGDDAFSQVPAPLMDALKQMYIELGDRISLQYVALALPLTPTLVSCYFSARAPGPSPVRFR